MHQRIQADDLLALGISGASFTELITGIVQNCHGIQRFIEGPVPERLI